MPSPKSGTAGSLVKPTAPDATVEADNTTGGQTTDKTNGGSKEGGSTSSTQVSAAGEPKAPEHKPEENKDKKSWIELQLVYESNGLPVPGMPFTVTLPDGATIAGGSTDENGLGRVDCIDPGSCQISFITLDKDAWTDA